MTTQDKHCQTKTSEHGSYCVVNECVRGMYDETVPVLNAKEIESPPNSEEEVVRTAMSKFNPPARHTARHDFDSDSDSDSEPKFMGRLSGEDESPDRNASVGEKAKDTQKAPSRPNEGLRKSTKHSDTSNSDTDSGDVEREKIDVLTGSGRRRGAGVVIPAEGAYDPKQFQDLKVPADMENIFQYILKYTPQKIDIEFKLQPFVPEYVPAVGDTDAFLKVLTPARDLRARSLADALLEHIDNLGLTVLDEPAAEQSDSALLHLQLRAISKTSSAKATVLTKKIDNAEKNPKAIERWIKDVSELHLSKPPPTVTYTSKMPDIDTLMEEWPATVEETLNEVGFPSASLACPVSQYAALACGALDVPVRGAALPARVHALHTLFSLYSAVKHSQLYVQRQRDQEEG